MTRQERAQNRRDIKRLKAVMLPMFKQMQNDIQNPEYTKEMLLNDISGFINELEELK